jgi:5-methylcytosine-specific restriction protein A
MPYAPPKHAPSRFNAKVHRPPGDDRRRNAEKAQAYDAAWRALRVRFLAIHPVCQDCAAPATDVDHILAVRSHPWLRLEWSNLRAYCHSCHSKRTNRDQGGWSRKDDADR